jgi:hypothetical protein
VPFAHSSPRLCARARHHIASRQSLRAGSTVRLSRLTRDWHAQYLCNLEQDGDVRALNAALYHAQKREARNLPTDEE